MLTGATRPKPRSAARAATTGTMHSPAARAYALAYFIHADKAVAVRIAAEAIAKLEVARRTQRKRRYYRLRGRRSGDLGQVRRSRNRVEMTDLHLLQRLVYCESARLELLQERGQAAGLVAPDERAMLIRFIEHLVRIATKRSSLYVTVGITRILYDYQARDTAEIFAQLVQAPERVPDDAYFRLVKRRLIKELEARFPGLGVSRGRHGEQRLGTARPTPAEIALVQACLDLFTPWHTACPIPTPFDRWEDQLGHLRFDGTDPDQEHPIEVSRMHSVLHPSCLASLVAALSLEQPAQRLTIPEFTAASAPPSDDDGPGSRLQPPPLGAADLRQIEQLARQRQGTGGGTPLETWSVVVDGCHVADWSPSRGESASVEVGSDAELLEVYGGPPQEGPLLAVHLLAWQPLDRSPAIETISYPLGWGRRLCVSVRPQPAGEHEWAYRIEVRHETLATIVRDALTGYGGWLRAARAGRWGRIAWQPWLVAAAVAAVAIGVSVQPGGREMPIEGSAGASGARQSSTPTTPDETAAESPDVTRGDVPVTRQPRGLHEVQRIYVDPLGQTAAARRSRAALQEALGGLGAVTVVDARADADAVIKTESGETRALALVLVNATGEVLWRFEVPPDLESHPAALARQVAHALASAVASQQPGR